MINAKCHLMIMISQDSCHVAKQFVLLVFVKIEKEAINKEFKCFVCLTDHLIPDDGFVLNKKICSLILTEPFFVFVTSIYVFFHLKYFYFRTFLSVFFFFSILFSFSYAYLCFKWKKTYENEKKTKLNAEKTLGDAFFIVYKRQLTAKGVSWQIDCQANNITII